MNDPNSNPIPPGDPATEETRGQPGPAPAGYDDWRAQRRAERWARRDARWHGRAGRHTGWFAGVVLILLGLLFLLEQLNVPFLFNWWALFILIPAFWAFMRAWDLYQQGKQFTRRVTSSLVLGLLLTAMTVVFLLNVGGGFIWPVLLILGGLALLTTALVPE